MHDKGKKKKFKYVFRGKVYPSRVNFNLSGLEKRYPGLVTKSPDWDISGSFGLVIKQNSIVATFETDNLINEVTNPNIETVKNTLERSIRSFVDAFCFAKSYSYDIDIKSVKCAITKFSYTFPVVGERNIKDIDNLFVKVLDVMLIKGDTALPLALADFRRSIKYPSETANFCLRSLESIRRIYFDDPSKIGNNQDKDGWKAMSKELRTERDSVYEDMRTIAEKNRHGIYPLITFNQRQAFMNYSRKVILKFIEWLKANSQQVP